MAERFPHMKSGTEITPYHFNIIYRELNRLRKMKFFGPVHTSGIDSTESTPEVWVLDQDGGPLAYTSSGITARSGTTLGTGTATIQNIDAGSLVASADPAADVDVVNFSGTAIDAGKYVMLTQYQGYYVVTAVEC